MVIKSKLVRKSVAIALFFGVLLAAAIAFYICTASPYKQLSFAIKDFEYNSETGTGYKMLGGDGIMYTIAPDREKEFDASDFFYETSYNDKVLIYVKKSVDPTSKAIMVYGVECNGKTYLELNTARNNTWWIFVIIGFFLVLNAIIKLLQLKNVSKYQAIWKQRRYAIIMYDKQGDLILVPGSTTSYLYPNVEMMSKFYAVNRGEAKEQLSDCMEQVLEQCYTDLANPSKLELQLKNYFGARSLKEFMQYQKLLYVLFDEKDGYYLRKMKSVLPAPEQNVYEIVTEGRHLGHNCTEEELVASILKETTWE